MPSAERLRQLLAASPGLAPTILDVEDVSDGCGAKFEVVVVSDAFAVSELGRGPPRGRLARLDSRGRPHAAPARAGQEAARAAQAGARGAGRRHGRHPRARAQDVDTGAVCREKGAGGARRRSVSPGGCARRERSPGSMRARPRCSTGRSISGPRGTSHFACSDSAWYLVVRVSHCAPGLAQAQLPPYARSDAKGGCACCVAPPCHRLVVVHVVIDSTGLCHPASCG